jgi:hypothetical protein
MIEPQTVHAVCLAGSNGKGWCFLTEAEEATYFGTQCIKGRSISPKADHWVHGSTIYIPTIRIEYVLTYESEAEYLEARSRYKPPTQPVAPPPKKPWFGKGSR